jgi:Ni,Fe-hydrogenase III small subunit/ferredoxin-like protein FixX
MFDILQKSLRTGLVTIGDPIREFSPPPAFRGAPHFDFGRWENPAETAAACPTGAISVSDSGAVREVRVDYGLCIFCGQCAEAGGGAVSVSREFAQPVLDRQNLVITARYGLDGQGRQTRLLAPPARGASGESLERTGAAARQAIRKLLGRSLAIREVDAGSCNGCEVEIHSLNNPLYDLERFGIHFVASPRHADMLLVTGPVTRNMELALRKTWLATPEPRLVVAAGACGISGGIFGRSYAIRGAVSDVIPVDVYVPGCPPRPEALLYGILLAVGRLAPAAAAPASAI